jgi:ubiquinone/menaquinone biosynthesis C-methylase UbiE
LKDLILIIVIFSLKARKLFIDFIEVDLYIVAEVLIGSNFIKMEWQSLPIRRYDLYFESQQIPMNIQTKRWQSAQAYEKEWWRSHSCLIDPEFYKAYAEELLDELNGIIHIKEDTRILEIGSGAAGIITHLPGRFRYAIDPLEDFFSSVERFQSFRDKKVAYHTGKAEDLPFEDHFFNLIIIDNVIDHCQDIHLVFSEMERVLTDRGIIYLRLNTYTTWGKFIRKIVELLKIDPGHPHTFTQGSLLKRISHHGYTIRKIHDQGYWTTWIRELSSMKLKEILKALSFSSPNKTLCLLEKS